MRKASQDGGDTTSITSGFENEYKKISTGIMKSTRNSLKKRVHSLSHEADDAVIEPLLQKDKENDKVDIASQSAKYLLSKTKTEQRDKEKLEVNSKVSQTLINIGSTNNSEPTVANGVKDNLPKTTTTTAGHAYTSPFANFSNGSISSATAISKSLISKEVKLDKPIGVSTGPLIFTTAKIHADGKTKQLEPVHVTAAPISSTIETNKTPSVANNEKVQDISVTKDIASQKSRAVKAMTNGIKVNQATATPDIIPAATKPLPISSQRQNTSTTGMSKSMTKEKLSKLETSLAESEGKEENVKHVNKIVTPVEKKDFNTDSINVKASKEVKDTVQPIKDFSCKSKDSKDTTIKIEPFLIGKKLDDPQSIGSKNDKLEDKAVNHDTLTKISVDKNPITKIDSQIINANKNDTKTIETPSVIEDKKAAKDTCTSSSYNKILNKVESIKQLQRQKKSTIDEASEADGKVKPKPGSALPTPTSAASNKALPKAEPISKKEADSSKVNKIGNATAKDIKDTTKTPKASETSLIPTKTTKVMNVAATTKPTTAVKTSTVSTIKKSSSTAASASTAASQPTSTAKPAPKATPSSAASISTSSAASTAKISVKVPENKSKDLSKDGKPSKA